MNDVGTDFIIIIQQSSAYCKLTLNQTNETTTNARKIAHQTNSSKLTSLEERKKNFLKEHSPKMKEDILSNRQEIKEHL
jgi:hypothetical protein